MIHEFVKRVLGWFMFLSGIIFYVSAAIITIGGTLGYLHIKGQDWTILVFLVFATRGFIEAGRGLAFDDLQRFYRLHAAVAKSNKRKKFLEDHTKELESEIKDLRNLN